MWSKQWLWVGIWSKKLKILILILTFNSQTFFCQLCSSICLIHHQKKRCHPNYKIWHHVKAMEQMPFVPLPLVLFWPTLLTSVHLVVNCLYTMSLTWAIEFGLWQHCYSNYFFGWMTFNSDILFEMAPTSKRNHCSSHM